MPDLEKLRNDFVDANAQHWSDPTLVSRANVEKLSRALIAALEESKGGDCPARTDDSSATGLPVAGGGTAPLAERTAESILEAAIIAIDEATRARLACEMSDALFLVRALRAERDTWRGLLRILGER